MSFKKELYELLNKHNACIFFSCSNCSDLHGVYDEKIMVTINEQDFVLADGYAVDKNDLKTED